MLKSVRLSHKITNFINFIQWNRTTNIVRSRSHFDRVSELWECPTQHCGTELTHSHTDCFCNASSNPKVFVECMHWHAQHIRSTVFFVWYCLTVLDVRAQYKCWIFWFILFKRRENTSYVHQTLQWTERKSCRTVYYTRHILTRAAAASDWLQRH